MSNELSNISVNRIIIYVYCVQSVLVLRLPLWVRVSPDLCSYRGKMLVFRANKSLLDRFSETKDDGTMGA